MSQERILVALKAYREALDAADLAMTQTVALAETTISEARRTRDAVVLLASAECQKVLDAESDPGTRITVSVRPVLEASA